MEFQCALRVLILAAVTATTVASGQVIGVKEIRGSLSRSELVELVPQHQTSSGSFESVRERVSSCEPSADKPCHQDYLPVCGSNGQTYNNEEELARAAATAAEGPKLRQVHEGMCVGLERQSGLDEGSFVAQGLESIGQGSFGTDLAEEQQLADLI